MAHRLRPQRMIRMRIWVMMVIKIMIMIMPVIIVVMAVFMPVVVAVVMIHIKPASPRTKTVAELTILDITSRG